MASTFSLPDMADMVSKHMTKTIEDAVYARIKPMADNIARQAAKDIAVQLKGYASHQMGYGKDNAYTFEPTIVLTFNGENIKV